jgi:hypothetical protein
MKILRSLQTGGSAVAQLVHKAIQGRSHGSKSESHRYERRRIREYLRHADMLGEENPGLHR